jgi:hypothetical protein
MSPIAQDQQQECAAARYREVTIIVRSTSLIVSLIILSGATSGCATRTYNRARDEANFRGAVEEPLRDLSVLRDAPPALLAEVAAAPFRLSADVDCRALMEEIAALDGILGPDIDVAHDPNDETFSATELLTGAVGGVWSLPYRSIVRRITGANRRERELRHAILAGMVRRGFLKGTAAQAGCSPSSQDSMVDQAGAQIATPAEDAGHVPF